MSNSWDTEEDTGPRRQTEEVPGMGEGKGCRQEWQGEKPPTQFAQSHLRKNYREEEHSAMSQV
jgi:hypothetical protein